MWCHYRLGWYGEQQFFSPHINKWWWFSLCIINFFYDYLLNDWHVKGGQVRLNELAWKMKMNMSRKKQKVVLRLDDFKQPSVSICSHKNIHIWSHSYMLLSYALVMLSCLYFRGWPIKMLYRQSVISVHSLTLYIRYILSSLSKYSCFFHVLRATHPSPTTKIFCKHW